MSQPASETKVSQDPGATEWEVGGLHLSVAFRRADGATLRVFGRTAGGWKEMLRFDDFIDTPHYHVSIDRPIIPVDRATLGDPMEFFVSQVRDHIGELLVEAGFADVAAKADLRAVAADADRIRRQMIDCVPEGYERVPGVGLQRVGA
ncbi:MAG: hypothetical protein J2P58_10810 [Acidimicrobiaceae bacterium]|nr:hypothetical protein [Acidimicrobiaceae bacterium]